MGSAIYLEVASQLAPHIRVVIGFIQQILFDLHFITLTLVHVCILFDLELKNKLINVLK